VHRRRRRGVTEEMESGGGEWTDLAPRKLAGSF
jgi:hypothetical protein